MKRNSLLIEERDLSGVEVVGGLETLGFKKDTVADLGGITQQEGSKIKKYQEALKYIFDEGPKQGVHVIMQVDKPANVFFDEYSREAGALFKHRVILKSENKHLALLRPSEEIDVQVLSDDKEHLRAYYYPDGESPILFTPFLLPETDNLFESILTK